MLHTADFSQFCYEESFAHGAVGKTFIHVFAAGDGQA